MFNLHINHRQFLAFLDIKKIGADHVCGGPGKRKNIFEKILSHALKLFSGSVRLGLLNKGQKFFSQNIVMLGMRITVFLRRFQKCKLTFVTKCT
jgi:hypothetical protein